MSDSSNHRDPFTDDPDDHETITSLVTRATQTHRKPEQSTRKRRRYPSEDERSKITLNLEPETIAELRAITREVGAKKWVSSVSQALVDYAVKAYRSGRIKLELRPTPIGFRLEAVEVEGNEK
jgi:hypothetical protein